MKSYAYFYGAYYSMYIHWGIPNNNVAENWIDMLLEWREHWNGTWFVFLHYHYIIAWTWARYSVCVCVCVCVRAHMCTCMHAHPCMWRIILFLLYILLGYNENKIRWYKRLYKLKIPIQILSLFCNYNLLIHSPMYYSIKYLTICFVWFGGGSA